MSMEHDMVLLMQRIVALLEDPVVRTVQGRDLRMKLSRLGKELAQLQADAGFRSPESAIAVAAQVQVIEAKYHALKVQSEGKRSFRFMLAIFAAAAALGFVRSGDFAQLAACLLAGHIWARWRI